MLDLAVMKTALEKCPECVSVEMNDGKLAVRGNPLVAVIRAPIPAIYPDLDREEIEELEGHVRGWCEDFKPGYLAGLPSIAQENRYLIWENYIRRDISYKPKDAFTDPYGGSPFEFDYRYYALEDGDYDRAIDAMVCETEYFPIYDTIILEAYCRWRKNRECKQTDIL